MDCYSNSHRDRVSSACLALLDLEDEKQSEWATACAIGTYAMNAGLNEDEFVELVKGSDFSAVFASENGRDRTGRLESRLRKVWARVEDAWNPPLNPGHTRERLVRLQREVETVQWKGRAGVTDRTVALAVIQQAHHNGAWTLDLSARRLAELSGVGRTTVSKSLSRLVSAGFMRRVEREDDWRTARFNLNLEWSGLGTQPGHINLSPHTQGHMSLSCPFVHPVFLAGALGATAGRLWSELPPQGSVTVKDVAESLRLHPKTVRRNLDRLVSVGMAAREGRPVRYSPVAVSEAYLDELAASFGTSDWVHRTAERHNRERAGYAEVLRQQQVHRFNPSVSYVASVYFINAPVQPVGWTYVVDPHDPRQVIAAPILSGADERRVREELMFS